MVLDRDFGGCYYAYDWSNALKIDEMAEVEHKMLRSELHDVKECQFRFLSAAVIAAGALLSITGAVQSRAAGPDAFRMAYLVPLVVLIPCWWGFFDKAKTITRIVGYIRILEGILLDLAPTDHFLGWERALGEFRKAEAEGTFGTFVKDRFIVRLRKRVFSASWWKRFLKAVLLIPSQRYWLLAHWTFALLSFVSVLIPFLTIALRHEFGFWQFRAVLFSLSIVVYTFFSNLGILDDLIYGRHSYDANFEKWHDLLTWATLTIPAANAKTKQP